MYGLQIIIVKKTLHLGFLMAYLKSLRQFQPVSLMKRAVLTRLMYPVSPMKRALLTRLMYPGSPPVFNGVQFVLNLLVFCVMLRR
jgi:hypothetical protein